ncbi:MAG: lamin tail domain-containing protein, partial [Verrucomicrobiota bacterium]
MIGWRRHCLAVLAALALVPKADGVPRITEFSANNQNGLEDEDGETSDWIEILNPGPADLDLDGFSLTDDLDDLKKWTFPRHVLGSGQRFLVFASGKDRRDGGERFHTNFRLGRNGGWLALVDGSGLVVSQFADYPMQPEDVSYGLDGDEAG